MKVNRTFSCEECGEVLFGLKEGCGEVEWYCKKCGLSYKLNLNPYETYNPRCRNCSNDTFKIKIQVDEEMEEQYAVVVCASCSENATIEYMNRDGEIIDEQTREKLIMDDRIEELEGELEYLEDKLRKKESEIEDLEDENYRLKNEVRRLRSEVEELE